MNLSPDSCTSKGILFLKFLPGISKNPFTKYFEVNYSILKIALKSGIKLKVYSLNLSVFAISFLIFLILLSYFPYLSSLFY